MAGGALNTGGFMGDARNQEGVSGTSGGCNLKTAEATGTATAAKTFSIAVNVPTNCVLVGCQLRNDVALTSSDGGTAYSAAFAGGSTAACGTAVAFAKNTKTNTFFDTFSVTAITTDVTTITVTADSAKTFEAGGKVTAIVYYFAFDTMASL